MNTVSSDVATSFWCEEVGEVYVDGMSNHSRFRDPSPRQGKINRTLGICRSGTYVATTPKLSFEYCQERYCKSIQV